MTEEEKQIRSNRATAEDIYNALEGVLGDLVEIYSIVSRWRNDREDMPKVQGKRTEAQVALVRQYIESIDAELSARSFVRLK